MNCVVSIFHSYFERLKLDFRWFNFQFSIQSVNGIVLFFIPFVHSLDHTCKSRQSNRNGDEIALSDMRSHYIRSENFSFAISHYRMAKVNHMICIHIDDRVALQEVELPYKKSNNTYSHCTLITQSLNNKRQRNLSLIVASLCQSALPQYIIWIWFVLIWFEYIFF